MVATLTIQLFVVLYLIDGRFAYRDYLSDDASDYQQESNPNSGSNETPGKRKIFRFKIGFKSIFPRKSNVIT